MLTAIAKEHHRTNPVTRARQSFLPLNAQVFVAACALSASALVAPAARAEIKERIAAVVNGQPVLLSDVEERVSVEIQKMTAVGPARDRERLEFLKRGLEQLIDDKLIEAEAMNLGVEVADEEVMRQVEALAKQNAMTTDQFRTALGAQGISFDLVKDSLRRQALQFRLLQYKVKPRKVSDEEVQAAYAALYGDTEVELRVRNFLVATPSGSTPETLTAAKAKVDLALSRLAKGEEFAVVARDLSESPTAHEGGDLGWVKKGTLFREADDQLFALHAGGQTRVIQNADGYQIFKVADRRQVAQKPISEVQEELRMRLANDSIMKERENYLKALRKAAQIESKL